MNYSRSALALASLLASGVPQSSPSFAQAGAPIGIVDDPCPPPVPLPPSMEAFLEAMLDPRTPAAGTRSPGGPAAEALARTQEEQKARDWANLCRYRSENAALEPGEVKVVFMGDSITEAWLRADRAFFRDGIVDRGIGGQTSPQMLLRFYADVVALRPRAVHIMTGTNDVAGNTGPSRLQDYQRNVSAMVDIAQAHGLEVLLASIPPADRFSWQPDLKPAAQIIAMNAWLKELAVERKLTFVDYHSALATPDGGLRPDVTHDGVHPHRGGYAIMRPLAEAAISRALE